MSAAEVLRLAYREFVAGEDGAGDKREYWDGFVLAMSGGSVRHSALSTRVLTELAVRLRGSTCEPYNSDLRVRVEALNASFYPDVTVVCGAVQTASDDPNAAINPTLLVEVLSPSTQSYDRVAKWNAYSRLASLKAYLLVDATTGTVELYERDEDPDRWRKTALDGPNAGALPIDSLGVSLDLGAVFRGWSELPE
jgi:Uma2 family endonuclease